jgi:hypothetical protein
VPRFQITLLRYTFFKFFLAQASKHRLERLTAVERLSGEASIAIALNRSQQLMSWIRRELRRAPKWVQGHLFLGQECLAAQHVMPAYASAQAALLLLGPEGKTSCLALYVQAQILLAECYLAKGSPEVARRLLEDVRAAGTWNARVAEDLAAALLLEGKEQEAAALLRASGSAQKDPAALAVLSYAKRKAEGGLPPLA